MATGEFTFPTLAQSTCIHYDEENVTAVEVKISEELGVGDIQYYIGYTNTLDTNITWELLDKTNNETKGYRHNFANTGQYIYWKAVGQQGAKCNSIKIKIIRE